MTNAAKKPGENTVIIRRCEEYDRSVIERLVVEGMGQLGYVPSGNIFAKPNVVFAGHPDILGTEACTNPAVIGGTLMALAKSPAVKRVDMGEKSAMGFPTRACYRYAGYYDEVKKLNSLAPSPVGIFCIDEELRDTVFIGGAVHDTLRVARKMARADSKVYIPKLKGHCVSNMTGAVKLNIGSCSEDERAIRHDFLLDEKIVDLLSAGNPDFVVVDAIDVGVGNEAFPKLRKLGLIIMGTNAVAVDIVCTRLLGFRLEEIPYLKLAVARGYTPSRLEDITLKGDVTNINGLDELAKRIMPYDDEFYRWQDVSKELTRLRSPMRFYWGPYRDGSSAKCLTGCVMGLKMFLASYEKYGGPRAFATARPVIFVIGKCDEEIDAKGERVFLLGTCARAKIKNAKYIMHIDKCFTTASDMTLTIGNRLGMRSPLSDMRLALPMFGTIFTVALRKLVGGRYFQDIGYFISKRLMRKI